MRRKKGGVLLNVSVCKKLYAGLGRGQTGRLRRINFYYAGFIFNCGMNVPVGLPP
jgi:hypothetical protein